MAPPWKRKDTTAPTISITSPVSNSVIASSSVLVTGITNDNVAATQVLVSMDGQTFLVASGTSTWSIQYNSIPDGSHTVSAKAKDAAGNTSAPVSVSFLVNTVVTPPPPPPPPGGLPVGNMKCSSNFKTMTGVSVSWTRVANAASFSIYRDNTKVVTLPASNLTSKPQITDYYDAGLLVTTTHTYQIEALDASGIRIDTSDIISVTTSATRRTTPLRTIFFAPQIDYSGYATQNNATLVILKRYYGIDDGVIASRDGPIKTINNYIGKNILTNHYLAPRIALFGSVTGDSSCGMGYVADADQFINGDGTQGSTSGMVGNTANGYKFQYLVSDIEGWCWTPTTERNSGAYVNTFDTIAAKAHASGFKGGIQPTHDELVLGGVGNTSGYCYPTNHVNFQNIDFFLVQFQKYYFTWTSDPFTPTNNKTTQSITGISSTSIGQIKSMINAARSLNPNITIFLQFNWDWGTNDWMLRVIDLFNNATDVLPNATTGNVLDGVSTIHQEAVDPDVVQESPPFQGYGDSLFGSPSHMEQFLKAVKSI